MVSRVATVAFAGIEARLVDVQVQIAPGLRAFSIVGLPDKAVAESRDRVSAALTAIANHFKGTQVLTRPEPKIREAGADRLDMADIKGQETGKRVLEIAARVTAARALQAERFEKLGTGGIVTNAACLAKLVDGIARPDEAGAKLLHDAAEAMHLTARGYHRVLRVARTLADLDGAETLGRLHLAEALSYRGSDTGLSAAA